MSQQLIDLDPHLKRLRDEGYCIEVRSGHLLIHRVPYVSSRKTIELGAMVTTLHMSGGTVLAPDTHVMYFIGEHPCHKDGQPIHQIMHQDVSMSLDVDLTVSRSFSNKPANGYQDYYQKVSTYADIISAPASSLDPEQTAKSFFVIKSGEEDSVFHYYDTASSRAGIKAISRKLELRKIALIGLGGTGSYILDLVAKTPVKEILLIDGDRFHSHNAFRSPGAASINELETQSLKVDYFHGIYSKMRKGIHSYGQRLSADNEALLDGVEFAFVSIDSGDSKRFVLQALERHGIPYIDSGMGIEVVEGALVGQVRTTTSLPGLSSHIWQKSAVSFSEDAAGNEYGWNIQIAELNALNAALAVIRWKKLAGFYLDLEQELHSIYPIDGNTIMNAYQKAEEGVAA